MSRPVDGPEAEYEANPREWVRRQVELYEATDGVEGGTLEGKPVVILTHRGARSGKIRKTPLMRMTEGDTYVVVASDGGATAHPFTTTSRLSRGSVFRTGRRCWT